MYEDGRCAVGAVLLHLAAEVEEGGGACWRPMVRPRHKVELLDYTTHTRLKNKPEEFNILDTHA